MRTLIVLLAVDLALAGFWVLVRIVNGAEEYSPTELTPPIVIAGVLVAIITLASNRKRNESEDYLESAGDLLEKAYEILSQKDESGLPQNKRLHWLTAARLIRTSASVAGLITEESHKRIWAEQHNYWRGRFYDLIRPSIDGFPESYFAEKPEHMIANSFDERDPIAPRSLAVLYRFVRWPSGTEDPLNGELPFSDEEIEQMQNFGPRHLGDLLEKVKALLIPQSRR